MSDLRSEHPVKKMTRKKKLSSEMDEEMVNRCLTDISAKVYGPGFRSDKVQIVIDVDKSRV